MDLKNIFKNKDKKTGKENLSPLLQKVQKSKEEYSIQAVLLLREFNNDFDIDDFEKWVRKNIFIIGPSSINQYLMAKAYKRHAEKNKDAKIKAVEKELIEKKLPVGQIASIINILKQKIV